MYNITHMQNFVKNQSSAAFADIRFLEVSLAAPQPGSYDDPRYYYVSDFREKAIISLRRLLWKCTKLVELRILDVDNFEEIFEPIEEKTKTCFERCSSLDTLTIVCRYSSNWQQ